MAYKDIEPTRLRCPHCREMIDVRVESKVKVAVRKPFTLPKPKG